MIKKDYRIVVTKNGKRNKKDEEAVCNHTLVLDVVVLDIVVNIMPVVWFEVIDVLLILDKDKEDTNKSKDGNVLNLY